MYLNVNTASQSLSISEHPNEAVLKVYEISTSRFGLGEENNSFKTPRGIHYVRAKIGSNEPINSVFIARRPTGEIYNATLGTVNPERDWILTRILWLSGKQIGINRLGSVDTMRRFIYIHGCPEDTQLGIPSSIGCIRMSNAAIVELFEMVTAGDIVNIF